MARGVELARAAANGGPEWAGGNESGGLEGQWTRGLLVEGAGVAEAGELAGVGPGSGGSRVGLGGRGGSRGDPGGGGLRVGLDLGLDVEHLSEFAGLLDVAAGVGDGAGGHGGCPLLLG